MPNHLLHTAALCAAFLTAVAEAAPLTLDAALDLAVQRSEAARAGRAAVASAGDTARAAGQLPDPTLRVGIDNLPATGPDRFNSARDFMTMKRIGISQEWVAPTKRSALETAAATAVGREITLAGVAVADTRLQTALAYVDAYYAAQALRLTTLLEHHAHEELEAARARLASATGNSAEVLALAGARAIAEDESAEVRQQQNSARLALQRWIGSAPDALDPLAPPTVPAEAAYVAGHPTVLALQRDLDVARGAAAATASQRRPNWTWEVSYAQRTGYSDMVSVGVSIPLQIAPAQRQDRETAAKLGLVEKTEAMLAEATRAAVAEYRTLASETQRLRERIERYRTGVVGTAEQRTAVATAAYGSNQASLMTLFEARHAVVETQRKLLLMQRDLARTETQLAYRTLTSEVAR